MKMRCFSALSYLFIHFVTSVVGSVSAVCSINYHLHVYYIQMRYTEKVSAWPVAFVGGLIVEKPILAADGKVKKWNSVHKPERPYPMGEPFLAFSPSPPFDASHKFCGCFPAYINIFVFLCCPPKNRHGRVRHQPSPAVETPDGALHVQGQASLPRVRHSRKAGRPLQRV